MKIAIIDPSSRSLPYDYFFIKELSKYYQIDFYGSYTLYNAEYLDEINKLDKVKVFKKHISNRQRFSGAFSYLIVLFQFLMKKKEYDRIHFMWSILPLLELPFFILIRKKLFFTFHNDVPHGHKKETYWSYRLIFRFSRKVIFVSDKVKEYFISNYKIRDSNKILVLKHGIMSIDLKEFKRPENVEKLEKKIIFWGNVKNYKGIDTFLRISEDKCFKDFDLEIYGKWDKELFNLKKTLISKGIKVYDSYLPSSELIKLLNTNGIFVLPYDKATQSGVLYTLLYYNRIFISTYTGDNGSFLVEANLEQLLFDNKYNSDIKRAVDYCLENEEKIKMKLAEMRNSYEWRNVLNEVKNIYEL